jgi:clan AA aspartic protease (TIGR02281 family)
MPHLFTVKWPHFARLEAVLLFPVAILLASECAPVRSLAGARLMPALAPLADRLGLTASTTAWTAVAIIVSIPYLLSLMLADRFLSVRKGFAVLSLAAIALWIWAAVDQSSHLATLVPESMANGTDRLSFTEEAAIAAGVVAFLLHLRPLCIGLQDQGEVAMHLLSAGYGAPIQMARGTNLYYRNTADSRDWRPHDQAELYGGRGPRENAAVKMLYAITWIGIAAGTGFAYFRGVDLATRPAVENGARAPRGGAVHDMPEVPTAPASWTSHTISSTPAGTGIQHASLPPSPLPPASVPMVQRPGELPTVVQPSYSGPGSDEAIAERGHDGGFSFQAVVNGTDIPMMFDTGASVVGLRAEDAERIGIDMSRLNYSAKVKTANGTAEVAPVIISSITIGNITQLNVVGFVARHGTLHMNLLGQSFLARLAGYNVESNRLVLRGR